MFHPPKTTYAKRVQKKSRSSVHRGGKTADAIEKNVFLARQISINSKRFPLSAPDLYTTIDEEGGRHLLTGEALREQHMHDEDVLLAQKQNSTMKMRNRQYVPNYIYDEVSKMTFREMIPHKEDVTIMVTSCDVASKLQHTKFDTYLGRLVLL